MDKAKEALWTRSFVLDTLINFLVFLIYYLLIVIIAVVARIIFMPQQVKLAWPLVFILLVLLLLVC